MAKGCFAGPNHTRLPRHSNTPQSGCRQTDHLVFKLDHEGGACVADLRVIAMELPFRIKNVYRIEKVLWVDLGAASQRIARSA